MCGSTKKEINAQTGAAYGWWTKQIKPHGREQIIVLHYLHLRILACHLHFINYRINKHRNARVNRKGEVWLRQIAGEGGEPTGETQRKKNPKQNQKIGRRILQHVTITERGPPACLQFSSKSFSHFFFPSVDGSKVGWGYKLHPCSRPRHRRTITHCFCR